MRRTDRHFIPKCYYYATPLFILLDYLLGINIRVSALDTLPLHKNIYYGFCIICALSIYILPKYSPIVALIESATNSLMIIFLLFLPYARLIGQDDILGEGWHAAESFSAQRISNLVLAGAVAVFALSACINRLGTSPILKKQVSIHPPDIDTNKHPDQLNLH
jgi:hypothetical protein